MATDKTLELEHGDLARLTKLSKLHKLGPKGKGFCYDYVRQCLDENDPRENADIRALATALVSSRKLSAQLMAQVKPRRK